MVEKHMHHTGPSGPPLPRMYSPTLQPLLQSLLSTLANIDFEHERECDRISKASAGGLKLRMLQKLNDQHQERRGPYVQQLAILEDRIRRAAA